jgi:signal transduction histidine kinase/ActR/RegA family two-component response regulator
VIAQHAIDYSSLLDLRRQFGLDFSIWDGDRLQATTLSTTADVMEAENARHRVSTRDPVYSGQGHYFARASFSDTTLDQGTLLVAIDTQSAQTLARRLSVLYSVVGIGVIGIIAAGAFFSAHRIVQPIRRLAEAADAAAGGDLDHPPEVEGPREIRDLAASFGEMLVKRREAEGELLHVQEELEERVAARTLALRQSEEHLLQARQLEALGRLAGGVAHDFNNVLTAIGGNAELIAAELSSIEAPRDIQEGVAEIRQSTAHAAGIVRQLMAFSRQQVAEPVVLDLGPAVVDLEKMLRRLCPEDVRLNVSIDSELQPILADPTQVGQILVNLVVNARDALPQGGNIRVHAYGFESDPTRGASVAGLERGRYVCLEVADDGVGMDPETAQRIFEPFFSTKAPGRGTGMGLATVHGIVQQLGGQIDVQTEQGHGTTFRLFFPVARRALSSTSGSTDATAPRGREAVLLCEDDASVRTLAANFLRSGDYEVLTAGSGHQALELAESRPDISLLVTDVVMPEINGVQLARRLRERLPKLKVLYLSGYTASVIDSRTDTGARDELLAKPFSRSDLLGRVRCAIDGGRNADGASSAKK